MTTNELGAGAQDGTSAAARLLELAARNADELLGEAKSEADRVVAAAHADAAQVHAALEQTRAEHDAQLEKTRAEHDAELERRRMSARADLAELSTRQTALETEIGRLKQVEQEHRDRMRSYLTQQLEQIDSSLHLELRRPPGTGPSEQRSGS